LGTSTFTALANEPDPGRQGQYLSRVFRLSSLLYLGAGSGVALLAPLAIVPLFGREFAPAVKPAAVLALVTSLAALGNILNEGLRGLGKTSPGIGAQFLGGGVVALGAWLLVPSYGLMGMAGAAVLGALGQLLVLLAVVTVLLRLSPAQLWGFRLKEVKSLWGRLREVMPLWGWLPKVKK
jgi:O-antigen/teichoic acid export membrane protein